MVNPFVESQVHQSLVMPPGRGDGMRGLAVFISDIRNCEYSLLVIVLHDDLTIMNILQVKVKKPKSRG